MDPNPWTCSLWALHYCRHSAAIVYAEVDVANMFGDERIAADSFAAHFEADLNWGAFLAAAEPVGTFGAETLAGTAVHTGSFADVAFECGSCGLPSLALRLVGSSQRLRKSYLAER